MVPNEIGRIRCSRRPFLKPGCRAVLLLWVSSCCISPMYGQHKGAQGLPDGDGKQLVTLVCSQCHGLREIEILRDGQQGWRKTVDRMVLYGAQLTPSEADDVTRYLATELGPDKGIMHSGTIPHRDTSGNGAQKSLLPAGRGRELVATRCVQCHSLEKVVSTSRSKADWVSITHNMVQRGLQGTPEEIRTIISYLQANFSESTQANPQGSPQSQQKED